MSNSFYSKSNNKKRQDAAWDFINGGNVGNRLQIVGASYQGCIDSSDCASGWRCSGGICLQKGAGAGSRSYGDDTGCGTGSGTGGGGGGGGGCNAGTSDTTRQRGLGQYSWKSYNGLEEQSSLKSYNGLEEQSSLKSYNGLEES